MAFALQESVPTVVPSGSSTPNAQFTGSGSIGDLIVVTAFSYNNDTDIITSISCDKVSSNLTRLYFSPNQSLTERTYLYYGEMTSSGVPSMTVTHTNGNNVQVIFMRFSKSVGTFSALYGTANGSGVSPAVTVNSVPANSLLVGSIVTNSSRSAPSGFTSVSSGNSWNWESTVYLLDSGAAGNQTATWQGGNDTFTGGLAAFSVDTGPPVATRIPFSGSFGRPRTRYAV